MCGIAGLLQLEKPVDRGELARFTDALAHRGPDGRGFLLDGQLGLGHRRLAILGPGRQGRCPMPFGEGTPTPWPARLRGTIAGLVDGDWADAEIGRAHV